MIQYKFAFTDDAGAYGWGLQTEVRKTVGIKNAETTMDQLQCTLEIPV